MTDPQTAAKRHAATEAASRVASGMIVGLGSGSTAAFAVEEIGRRLRAGVLKNVVGIPTSVATQRLAETSGIPLTTLEEHPVVDLTIDGADEVDPSGQLIKGLGGALLREKMVATASRRMVVVVDGSKLVDRLGSRAPLPVEVVTFAAGAHTVAIRALGGEPRLRCGPGGDPYRTDEGHFILDCRFAGGIEDPHALQATLRARPGIVETGLFLDLRPEVIVGRVP